MAAPLLEASDVAVRRRGNWILDGVSLDLDAGVVGLVGPNGAGKTTFLRTLIGAIAPDRGTVSIGGAPMDGTRAGRRPLSEVGYVPQALPSGGRLSTAEFVSYFSGLHGVPRTDRAAAVARALERTRLERYRDQSIGTLSGGTLRRAVIAQAIVHSPRILLLDEPTAGLDPGERVAFREVVADLAGLELMVISTHLMEDVSRLASRVVLLSEGALRYDGGLDELRAMGDGIDRDGSDPLERAFLQLTTGG